MKLLLALVLLSISLTSSAQKFNIPDSVVNKFTTMLCNCMTDDKLELADLKQGQAILGKCFEDIFKIYSLSEEAESIKKAAEDPKNFDKFNEYIIEILLKDCSVFSKFVKEKMGQDKQEEVMIPEPLPTVKEGYFLDKKKMIARKMDLNNNDAQMHTWNAKNFKTSKIQIVYDIRYVFKNELEAKQYYNAKLSFLSEDGPEINNVLKNLGVSQSNVYGSKSTEMFGDLDIQMTNYIFRIKNVVAKVFVSASKKATPAEMLLFAKEAIARIKLVK